MGDAAHAMVPFYGQGMNCGFEDCSVLNDLFTMYGDEDIGLVLEKYTAKRVDNCHTIIDLAMYNYVEMRDLVNRKTFLIRKKFDNLMHSFVGNSWIPLYTMVTFSRIPYKKCMDDKEWQDQMIGKGIKLLLLIFGLIMFTVLSRTLEQTTSLDAIP